MFKYKINLTILRILIMAFTGLSGIIGTGLIGPNRSSIEATYSINHSTFGLGIAIIQIICSIVILLNSSFLKRFNEFKILTTGLFIQSLGLFLIYSIRSISGIIIGWTLIIVGSFLGAIINNISMDLWKDNPHRGVTLLHSFNGIGKVIGPLIVAISLSAGWYMGFFRVAIISFSLFLFFLIFRNVPHQVFPKKEVNRDFKISNYEIFKINHYWICVISFGLIAGGEAAFVTLMPLYFEKIKGMSKEISSVLLTVHLLGLVAGRFLSAYFSGKVEYKKIIGFCMISGIFVFPAIFAESVIVRVISLFLFGFMFSTTWPTFYAQISKFFQGKKEILAYSSFIGTSMGISLCILISSFIADYNLTLSLLFGPAILWLFSIIYYTTVSQPKFFNLKGGLKIS